MWKLKKKKKKQKKEKGSNNNTVYFFQDMTVAGIRNRTSTNKQRETGGKRIQYPAL